MLLCRSSEKSTYSFAHIWFFTFSGTRWLRGIAKERKVFLLWHPCVSCGLISLSSTFSTVSYTVRVPVVPCCSLVLAGVGSCLGGATGSGTNWIVRPAAAVCKACVTAAVIVEMRSGVSWLNPIGLGASLPCSARVCWLFSDPNEGGTVPSLVLLRLAARS